MVCYSLKLKKRVGIILLTLKLKQMKTILFLGLNAIASLFVTDKTELELEFPEQQAANEETFVSYSDYVYSSSGRLISAEKNDSYEDNFFIQTEDEIIEIDLNGSKEATASSEIGYLARILATEALVYTKNGNYYNISMFTRICIAESIKNRKNSDFGFYANYDTYRSVIFYTGYATNGNEFTNTKQWLNHRIAKMRFVEEVLPVAIFTYFYETNYTSGATGFITPAKMSSDMYQRFKKRVLIEIPNIDPYYEFTFWKY